ncbi:hypothetical protein Tco_0985621, partial [Tanacetum coccineum]
MSTYLKNMAGYKHNQLKSKNYDEIQEMFDKEMKRLKYDNSKKQKIDKHIEAKKDDDQKEADKHIEAKSDNSKKQKIDKHIEIVKDDEVAIDAIALATKPPVIVKYKIVKKEKFVYFQLIRADGSSKRYLSM